MNSTRFLFMTLSGNGGLASNYLRNVHSVIVPNICNLEENCDGDPFASIKAQFMADRLLD